MTISAESLFDSPGGSGRRLRQSATSVLDALARWPAGGGGPCPSAEPEELARRIGAIDPCPDDPADLEEVLDLLGPLVLANAVDTTHPSCAAHLHSPTLLTAAATELAIGATNQSLDSYDQAPAATLVEDHLVRWLASAMGLPATASGVLTAGGTASNLLGLVLARDHAAARTPGRAKWSVQADGLPVEARSWRVLCSAAAHFSVRQAAAVAGLGEQAVVAVGTDDHGRMSTAALDRALAHLDDEGLRAIAVVGTAGTTDLGAIDPLDELADRAARAGAWFHVDAAVGSAFALSDRLRPLLRGLGRAQSVTADLHKLWWQPIGASVLLVSDAAAFEVLRRHSDYLNRAEDEEDGTLNLVTRSLDTSRRFDALKVLVSLRCTGRLQMAAMVEHVVDLAAAAAQSVREHPRLELLAPPSTVTVVFRWAGEADEPDEPGDTPVIGPLDCDRPNLVQPDIVQPDLGSDLDRLNTAVQRQLFAQGQAVVGRTRHRGRVALKLTFVNPRTTPDDVADLLAAIDGCAVALTHRERARPEHATSGGTR